MQVKICTGKYRVSHIALSFFTLKPNACNNKARRIKFHQYVRQFLPRDHGGFGHKNQKMSDFLGIAQKVRHFLILVPKTAMISWQKLANISMELAAPNVVLLCQWLQAFFFSLCKYSCYTAQSSFLLFLRSDSHYTSQPVLIKQGIPKRSRFFSVCENFSTV